jgi:hypothetical protein
MDPSEDDNLDIQKQLNIIKKMFIGGFLFLPWLWLCNYFYYKEYVKTSENNSKIKKYVYGSLIGFFIETIIFLIWLIIFLTHRNEWGSIADQISVYIPEGN